jgi:hypothetical protein
MHRNKIPSLDDLVGASGQAGRHRSGVDRIPVDQRRLHDSENDQVVGKRASALDPKRADGIRYTNVQRSKAELIEFDFDPLGRVRSKRADLIC